MTTVFLHPDCNDYRVDDAGYLGSTAHELNCLAQTIGNIGASLCGQTEPENGFLAELFGDVSLEAQRQEYAARLQLQVDLLRALVARLRGPQVDERNSSRVGWDANHSVWAISSAPSQDAPP